jgi:DNA repair protein RecN (Recombination protein N)
MLRSLYVKDFAIVGAAEIAFGPGMTVVTGETGAGKSLLVDALMLLAGGRADAAMVRHGRERAELSADFDLADRSDLREWLAAEELDDDDACQLRRVIRTEGSSRAWINGRPVTLAQLKALGEKLVEIHGQHEQQALLDRGRQLALLDAFGDHADLLAEVGRIALAWREVGARIGEIEGGADPAERIDWLRHQVAELDRDALGADELAALDALQRRLGNAGQLLQGGAGLADLIDADGAPSLTRLLARAQAEAARVAALDPKTAAIGELLDAARIQLDEAADALSRYRDSVDLDPERLAEAEAQLARLHDLARKHRVPVGGLKAQAETLRAELDVLQNAGTRLAQLHRERVRLATDHAGAAQRLSAARAAAARRFGDAVSRMLGELGMAGACLAVGLEATAGDDPDPRGRERAEFLVAANPGQPPRPLRKVASGGELSRISLAIEVAALGLDHVGTMVFDEVDSGIGGAVAEVVGRTLRRLGEERQVLCVTHLPQVAAQAHRHLAASKSSDGASTQMRIDALDGDARRDEIARMLGGIRITRETRAHARQMLGESAGD